MAKDLKLVTDDGERVPGDKNVVSINGDPQGGQPEVPNAPQNGEHFTIYPFEQRRALLDGVFETVPRNKRQRGKIAEAQRFRKAQGAYLSARLHFFDISQESSSQLKWWFASTHRVRIHHHLMVNYYLEDRPTPVEELIAKSYCSVRNLHNDLKHAVDLGSIEIDHTDKDKRQRVIYPTRGFIADTDNLFGREKQSEHENDGMFVFWAKQIDKQVGPFCDDDARYNLEQYHADFETYNDLITPHLPDTDRQF